LRLFQSNAVDYLFTRIIRFRLQRLTWFEEMFARLRQLQPACFIRFRLQRLTWFEEMFARLRQLQPACSCSGICIALNYWGKHKRKMAI